MLVYHTMECWLQQRIKALLKEEVFCFTSKDWCSNLNSTMEMQQMLQALVNPTHLFGEYLEEQAEDLNFSTAPSLEDKIPFLEMLQSAESPTPIPFSPLSEDASFQTLLKLQLSDKHSWKWKFCYNNMPEMESQIQATELESCITHGMLETNREQTQSLDNGNSASSPAACSVRLQPQVPIRPRQKSPAITRERRKRKRTARASKNKEEVENQRMTHIAVERNRRRQMNDHLNSLRSLMPPSYVQRVDQASIIGGAIDYVKELEQLLQYLQAQKRIRKSDESANNYFASPPTMQVTGTSANDGYSTDGGRSGEYRSEAADIKVTVIETHVNLKIECGRRPGQLLKVIVGLEDLRLTVLHLNITSSQSSVLYSFNLKKEDDCEIGTADGIAGSVNQIFNYINGS